MNYLFGKESMKTISVSSDLQLKIECGGRILTDYPYTQTTPLLPITQPKRLPYLCRPRFKQKAEPGRFNRTYNLGTGFSTRGNSTPYGYVGGRFFRYEQGVNSAANGSYGVEQYFGGSCVAIRDDFIFYTGVDGVLNIGSLKDSPKDLRQTSQDTFLTQVTAITSGSEPRINNSRIYSVSVESASGSEAYYPVARFKGAYSFFKFDTETCDLIHSIPVPAATCSECSPGLPDWFLLDAQSNVSIFDLEEKKVTFRKQLTGCEVERWSWGVLAKGLGFNSVAMGGRQYFGLLDVRSGKLELIKKFKPKIYLRNLLANGRQIYSVTDAAVAVYDVRQPLRPLLGYPLSMDHTRLVDACALQQIGGRSWVFAQTLQGNVNLGVLDYTHNNCLQGSGGFRPVDDNVALACTRNKKPDLCGQSKLIRGWEETVATARLSSSGLWLENSLQQRAEVDFRGIAVEKDDGNTARVVTVNALGDLFAASLSVGEDHGDQETEENNCHDWTPILDEWAKLVDKSTNLKMSYAAWHGYRGKKEKYKMIPTEERIPKKETNFRAPVNYDDFTEGVGRNILNILNPESSEADKSVANEEGEGDTEVVQPPIEEDPYYALTSFLNDLGVPEESQNLASGDTSISEMLKKINKDNKDEDDF